MCGWIFPHLPVSWHVEITVWNAAGNDKYRFKNNLEEGPLCVQPCELYVASCYPCGLEYAPQEQVFRISNFPRTHVFWDSWFPDTTQLNVGSVRSRASSTWVHSMPSKDSVETQTTQQSRWAEGCLLDRRFLRLPNFLRHEFSFLKDNTQNIKGFEAMGEYNII